MSRRKDNPIDDLRGIGKLAADATAGITDLVEAMHRNISPAQVLLDAPQPGRTRGLTGVVYRGIRGVTRLAGRGIDAVLARLTPLLQADADAPPSPARENVLAALNGVLGDYLAASENPLAISMQVRRNGHALDLRPTQLAKQVPDASGRLVLLVHGLCMNDLEWNRHGHDHGACLARDFGYSPVYLHYNSGLHVSRNGRLLANQLEALVRAWPVPISECVLIGHSMGGLVIRSACHYAGLAGHSWPQLPGKLVFLGTPHHGAPLERGGAWLQNLLGNVPLIAPFTRLGGIRSVGITDLRHGNVVDADWQHGGAGTDDPRTPTPLPAEYACYAIAASMAARAGTLKERLLGDGLVPVASALGRHAQTRFALRFGKTRQWVGYRMNHLDLLNRPAVYKKLARWLGPSSSAKHIA